jgi:hypothetical protein
MNSFEELLAKQKSGGLQDIIDAAKKATSYSDGYKDERFWRPTVDASGNGSAIIRFLPAKDQEIPWVAYFEHSFKSPISNRWYWENCPTSIGEACPCCEENSKKYSTGLDDLKKIASSRKRKKHYVSNIVVLKDPGNPENEGKVFLFKYGTKIFEKLMSAMEPDFDDVEKIHPFNVFSGAAFKLRQKKIDAYPNYDSSEFANPDQLYGGDPSKLKPILEQLHEISPFLSPDKYKPYADLKKKYFEITGENDAVSYNQPSVEAPTPTAKPAPTARFNETPPWVEPETEDEDEDMAYFKKLAAESE